MLNANCETNLQTCKEAFQISLFILLFRHQFKMLKLYLLSSFSLMPLTVRNCAELHKSGQRVSGVYTMMSEVPSMFIVTRQHPVGGGHCFGEDCTHLG